MPGYEIKEKLVGEGGEVNVVSRDPQDGPSLIGQEEAAKSAQLSSSSSEELVEESTKEELYEKAKEADVKGRSSMDKEELAEAVAESQEAPEDDEEDEESDEEDDDE